MEVTNVVFSKKGSYIETKCCSGEVVYLGQFLEVAYKNRSLYFKVEKIETINNEDLFIVAESANINNNLNSIDPRNILYERINIIDKDSELMETLKKEQDLYSYLTNKIFESE